MNRVHRRYALELLITFVLYLIVLVGSIKLLGIYGDTKFRYLLAVSPVLPAAGVLFTFIRLFRRVDELEQRMYLEGFAVRVRRQCLGHFRYMASSKALDFHISTGLSYFR